MLYEIKENKHGKFFIKNHQYWYLDQLEIWGLNPNLRYDTIDYNFYRVNFIEENGVKYIKLRKVKPPINNF
jgi:hypothetical protein